MTAKTYDWRCYDLGEAFLRDMPHLNTESRRAELAKLIQTAIEEFIADIERDHAIEVEP